MISVYEKEILIRIIQELEVVKKILSCEKLNVAFGLATLLKRKSFPPPPVPISKMALGDTMTRSSRSMEISSLT